MQYSIPYPVVSLITTTCSIGKKTEKLPWKACSMASMAGFRI